MDLQIYVSIDPETESAVDDLCAAGIWPME